MSEFVSKTVLYLLLISIGAGIVMIVVFKGNLFNTQQTNVSDTSTPTPTQEPGINRDMTCNYEVKFPVDWRAIKEEFSGSNNLTLITSPDFSGDLVVPRTRILKGSAVLISCEKSSLTSSKLKEECESESSDGMCDEMSFGELKVFDMGKNIYKGATKGSLYTIEVPAPNETTEEILSSFKFLK